MEVGIKLLNIKVSIIKERNIIEELIHGQWGFL